MNDKTSHLVLQIEINENVPKYTSNMLPQQYVTVCRMTCLPTRARYTESELTSPYSYALRCMLLDKQRISLLILGMTGL